jgi:hypothetical protein
MNAMKYTNGVALAGTVVWLVGCASAPRVVVDEPLGPAPSVVAQGTSEGSMVIYSARVPANVDLNMEEWRWNNDFGKNAFLYQPAHSDYTIYTPNGDVFKRVRNARAPNDDTPTVVTLPAGSYQVEAEGVNCDANRVKVLMAAVIKPGQTTQAHLDGDWKLMGDYKGSEFVKLPCGRVIGWRASETGYAGIQPGAQSN